MQDWPPPDDDTTQASRIVDSEAMSEDGALQSQTEAFFADEATHIHVAVPVPDPVDAEANPLPPPPQSRLEKRAKARASRGGGPPLWIFLIIAAVVLVITGGIWGFVLLGNTNSIAVSGGPTPTPIFVVITATPTPEVVDEPTVEVVEQAPDPIPAITATPAPQPIIVGSTVVVVGTEQAGLSVRENAGVAFPILFIAADGEIFSVAGGPIEADGFTWWNITDPADPARTGWAASAFLATTP